MASSSTELKFKNTISVDIHDSSNSKNINTLYDYIDLILESIGIPDSMKMIIKNKFDDYNSTSYMLLDNNQKQLIEQLLSADTELTKVLKGDNGLNDYYVEGSPFKSNWDNLMSEFATLQGLIIIRRVTKDCSKGIESLIMGIKNKLVAVNNLIEQDLIE